ncbi:MAG TPA: hypothetical protein VFT55_17590, partial [Planctomycetota bacterium]|nr:hypothetical protein [Planctomycetota bacterium]
WLSPNTIARAARASSIKSLQRSAVGSSPAGLCHRHRSRHSASVGTAASARAERLDTNIRRATGCSSPNEADPALGCIIEY